MAQYTAGTITTTAASITITGTGVEWTLVAAGDRIFVNQDPFSFEIATVTPGAGTSTLTLTAPYPTAQTDVTYVIVTDFTAQYDLPLMNPGDQKTEELHNRSMHKLDSFLVLFNYLGSFANATVRDAAIPSPDLLDLVYQQDTNTFWAYTGILSDWELWGVTAVQEGASGLNGLPAVSVWSNGTQLHFTAGEGGAPYDSPVELKGDAGEPGGLHWTGAWSASTTYAIDNISELGGVKYVCTVSHINQQPPNAFYWDVWEDSSFTPGTMIGYTIPGGFVEADLTVGRHLSFSDGIGSRPVHVTVTNNSGVLIRPTIDQSSSTLIDLDFSGWPTLVGTYTVIVSGLTP